MTDFEFMLEALKEAKNAELMDEVPVGAILVIDGQIISRAHNLRESFQDPTAHAELIVIKDASQKLKRWRLNEATLYVTLEPCPMCAGAIVLSRILRLVFGAYDLKAGASGSLMNVVNDSRLNHTVAVVGGILENESASMLREFFSKRRDG